MKRKKTKTGNEENEENEGHAWKRKERGKKER